MLTATLYNGDHSLHVTYNTPGGCDDASATVAAMRATADPGESGTESLSTDLLGEIQRMRHVLAEITGKTYWYQTPDLNLGSFYLQGANIALASTLVPVGTFEYADVTGSGINVTAIATEAAGTRRKLRIQNSVNFIHNASTLILPFGKIYRTYPGEFLTFTSNGTGWYLSDYSGPHDSPGMGRDFLGSAAPIGYVLQDNASLNCTDYEGLFTELVANLDQEGYSTPVGTITADNTNETITLAAHGLTDGKVVHFANTGGGLPAGITAKTIYYVRDATANTFKITATRGGSALDITTNGTGTNSVYSTFLAPDSRGRVDIGLDGSANRITSSSTNGANADTLRGTGGAQTHTLILAESPSHDHAVTEEYYNSDGSDTRNTPYGGTIHNGGSALGSDTSSVSTIGGNGAHSNTQPWRAVTRVVRY